MGHRGRLGTNTVESAGGVGTIPVGQPVPVGQTVLGAVVWSQDSTSLPTVSSITDSRSNSYAIDVPAGAGNSTASCVILRGTITTPLQVGDAITVTIGGTRQRWCLQADAFDDLLSSPLDRAAATDTGSSASLVTGTTAATQQPYELAYAAWGFGRGSSQNVTNVGGWNSDPQVNTTSGTVQRGLQVAHIYLTSTGAVQGTATMSASTTYAGCVATYRAFTRAGGTVRIPRTASHRAASW